MIGLEEGRGGKSTTPRPLDEVVKALARGGKKNEKRNADRIGTSPPQHKGQSLVRRFLRTFALDE